jgi:hypothetical protein
MAWTPIEIDGSVGRTDGARARVPEGYYLIECEGAEPTAEDFEKTAGIFVKIRIVQGPDATPGLGVGGRLRDYNTMGKKDAFFALGSTLKAFGLGAIAKQLETRAKAGQPLRLATYRDFAAFTENIAQRLTGRRAVALIADQPGNNGRPFSGVESLFEEADWATYRTAQMVGAPTAPQTMAAVAAAGSNGASSAPTGAADLFADLDAAL